MSNDFDFLHGTWEVAHRRLVTWLVGGDEWEQFAGTNVSHGFFDGAGIFYGDDTHDGRLVRVRFIWSHITPTSARWEQAFSVDGEQTWETNWVMEFTRAV